MSCIPAYAKKEIEKRMSKEAKRRTSMQTATIPMPSKKQGRHPKYCVVGGNPFRCYTGTTSFTGLRVVGTTSSIKTAQKMYNLCYEECGGLLLVIDMETGMVANV